MEMNFLIMALSYKKKDIYGNTLLCVAGIDTGTGEYVRIGHGDNCGPLKVDEMKFNNKLLKIGDVIKIDVRKTPRLKCQTENYELLSKCKAIVETKSYEEMKTLVKEISKPDDKYNDGILGSTNATIDPAEVDNNYDCSIRSYLISDITIYRYYNKKKMSFKYGADPYHEFSVTDSVISGWPDDYGPGLTGHFKEAIITATLASKPQIHTKIDKPPLHYIFISGIMLAPQQ